MRFFVWPRSTEQGFFWFGGHLYPWKWENLWCLVGIGRFAFLCIIRWPGYMEGI